MHPKQVVFGIIIVAIILGGLSAVFIKLFAQITIRSNPIEDAITLSEKLIDYATAYPIGKIPYNDIPSNLWVEEDCWELLQRVVNENGKTYQVTAYKNGIGDFRPVDDIIAQIDFSNGKRILIGYYEGGLTWCQEPKPK
jgi:hypothetical protein